MTHSSHQGSSGTSQAPRVLVVDDDPVVTRLVCGQLAGAGYRAFPAHDLAQARSLLERARFDLVLLDVMLPDGDGYSLCRELKCDVRYRELPVIFLTARGAEEEMLQGFEAGGVDYVVKPFDYRLLLARVSTHTTLARLSRNLQEALDERTESLRVAHRRMRELDVEMALTEERERRRLADQLHDTTIQQLVLAQILLDAERGSAHGAQDRTDQLRELLDLSVQQLRTLVFELSPPVLYQAGLFPALEWLAGELCARWPAHFECSLTGKPVELPDTLKFMLFNGARELMTNVGKHARASRAEVLLTFAPGALTLTVRDDGVGMHRATQSGGSTSSGGFGLFSLRSRVELLGGRLELRSAPGKGMTVSLRVPLAAHSVV